MENDTLSTVTKEQSLDLLLSEIIKGQRSGEMEGWLSIEQVESRLQDLANTF